MATAVQKITLSPSRDIPFNKLVLSQSNVRRVKRSVSTTLIHPGSAFRLGLDRTAPPWLWPAGMVVLAWRSDGAVPGRLQAAAAAWGGLHCVTSRNPVEANP